MSIAKRIVKNTGFLILPQITGVGLQFIFTVAIARYLGSADFGVFSFAFVFVQIFFSIAKLGSFIILVRDISRDKRKVEEYTNKAFTLRLLMFILTLGMILLAINLLGYSSRVRHTVYILALGIGLSSVFQVYLSIFRAFENMKYEGIGAVILNVAYVLAGIYVIVKGYGIIGLAIANLLANLIYILYIFTTFKMKFSCKIKLWIDVDFWKYLLKEGMPIGIGGIACFAYSNLDIVLLSMLRSPMEVGWYSAAKKIGNLLMNFPVVLYSSIFPIWSNYYKSDFALLQSMSVKVCKYMALTALPIAMAFLLLADKIVLFLYGQEYLPCADALQILIWIVVFTFIGNAFAFLLNSSNNSKEYAKLSIKTLLIFILFSLPLIPMFGIIGAAIASAFSQGIGIFLFYIKVSNRLFPIPLKEIFKKPLMASIIMGAAMFFARNIGLIWLLLLGGISYFFVFYLIKGFPKEDVQSAKSFLKRQYENLAH
jgi:O-antigen/teichoic acid export membrane protein